MISWDNPVGIDIEHQRKVEYLAIAKILYSKEEQAFLANLSPDVLPYYFFHIWSQKEALIKAIGMGLSFPTKEFTAILNQEQGHIKVWHQDWQLTHFMIKENCHGAYCHKPGMYNVQWLYHL